VTVYLLTEAVRTRKPCCRRELPRDARDLYKKLAPNPQATQWIETILNLSANMGSCQKRVCKCIFLLSV